MIARERFEKRRRLRLDRWIRILAKGALPWPLDSRFEQVPVTESNAVSDFKQMKRSCTPSTSPWSPSTTRPTGHRYATPSRPSSSTVERLIPAGIAAYVTSRAVAVAWAACTRAPAVTFTPSTEELGAPHDIARPLMLQGLRVPGLPPLGPLSTFPEADRAA